MATEKDSTRVENTAETKMPRPRMMLGIGEYRDQAGELERWQARRIFLKAVRAKVPKVLETLACDVLPPYRDLRNRMHEDPTFFPPWQRSELRPVEMWQQSEAEAEATNATFPPVHAWASQWNLNDPWLRLRALDTLAHWHDLSKDHQEAYPVARLPMLDWFHEPISLYVPLTDDDIRNRVELPCYEPWQQYREDAENNIRAEFEKLLGEYLDRVERLMEEQGWTRTKEKRNWQHFEWLVWYQVEGLTYDAVARRVQDSADAEGDGGPFYERETIRGEIVSTAKLIGLTLRHGRPGRPRGTKNRHHG